MMRARAFSSAAVAGPSVPDITLRRQTVVKQPGDGSCLFHALATYAEAGCTGARMRQRLMIFLASHPELRVAGNTLHQWIRFDSGLSLEQYCNSKRIAGWGGGLEMLAFTHAMQRRVRVFEQSTSHEYGVYRRIAEFGQDLSDTEATPRADILYQGRMHYDVLRPQEVAEALPQPRASHSSPMSSIWG